MSISYYNTERYPDPTPFVAIQNVCQEGFHTYPPRTLVLIVKSDGVLTPEESTRYCRFAEQTGNIPLEPLRSYYGVLNFHQAADIQKLYFFAGVLLTKCHELWVFGDGCCNQTMKLIHKAQYRNMRVRFFTTEMEEISI